MLHIRRRSRLDGRRRGIGDRQGRQPATNHRAPKQSHGDGGNGGQGGVFPGNPVKERPQVELSGAARCPLGAGEIHNHVGLAGTEVRSFRDDRQSVGTAALSLAQDETLELE